MGRSIQTFVQCQESSAKPSGHLNLMEFAHLDFRIALDHDSSFPSIFLKKRFSLFMRDTEKEAETQAEEEAGSCRVPNAGLDLRTAGL